MKEIIECRFSQRADKARSWRAIVIYKQPAGDRWIAVRCGGKVPTTYTSARHFLREHDYDFQALLNEEHKKHLTTANMTDHQARAELAHWRRRQTEDSFTVRLSRETTE